MSIFKPFFSLFFLLAQVLCFAEEMAYVVNCDGNSISVFDVNQDYTCLHTLTDSICGPTSIALLPNGTYAFVANAGNNTVVQLDINQGYKVTRTFSCDINAPYAVAATADSRFVYIANLGMDNVGVIDLAGAQPKMKLITNGFSRPYALAVTPDAQYVYVANLGDHSVSIIKVTEQNQVVKKLTKGIQNPYYIAITPNGKYAYIACGGNNTIVVVDIEKGHQIVQRITEGMQTPYMLAFTPDGKEAYVANYDGGCTILDTTKSNRVLQTIKKGICKPYGISFNRNGKQAHVINLGTNSVTVLDTEKKGHIIKTVTESIDCPYQIAVVSTNSEQQSSKANDEAFVKTLEICHLHDIDSLIDERKEMSNYLAAFSDQDYHLFSSEDTGVFHIDGVNDPIKNILRQGGIWEPHVHAHVKKYAKEGTTVLDIGSHIGTEAIVMAKCVGKSGKVHAFEPLKKNFRELWANCVANHVQDQVRLYHMGVGNTHTTVDAGSIVENSNGEVDEGGIGIWGGGETIEMRTIDSFGFSNVSLVKIDVEGAEDAVLDGMKKTLRENRPIVIIEICGGWIWETAPPDIRKRIERTKNKLQELGYEVIHLDAWDYIALPKNEFKDVT